MIQHIVLFKLKEGIQGSEKQELMGRIKAAFELLPKEIEVLRKLKIRENWNSQEEYDFQLIAYLEQKEDLQIYAEHPAHVALVAELIKPNLEKRAAVDVWACEME